MVPAHHTGMKVEESFNFPQEIISNSRRIFLRANNSLSFHSLPTLDLREKFATARFFQWASIVRGGLAKAEARGRTKMVNQERAQERLRNNKRSQVMRIVIDFKDAYSQLTSFFNGR
jgi:hypothetical protein